MIVTAADSSGSPSFCTHVLCNALFSHLHLVDTKLICKMPAVAKKSVAAKAPSKEKVVKKQSLKKTQKTESIKAAKKLAKLQSKKAISDKVRRTRVFPKRMRCP